MEAYFVRDNDPSGGYLDMYRHMPVISNERNTIQEVRQGDFPSDLWLQIMLGEVTPDPVTFFDAYYQPHFDAATVVWTREGGTV